MKNFSILVGLSLCFFPIMVQAKDLENRTENIENANICTTGYFHSRYKYRIYREDDFKRKNPVGSLKIFQGKGYLDNFKNISLQEAERLWGTPRTSLRKRGESQKFLDSDWKVFNVIGIGYLARDYLDKPLNVDNRPKYFYIYAKILNDRLIEYAIDGPNIPDFTTKSVVRVKEEGASS